ncbi:MAG: SMP-30/gluconolactonase/LRE family protein [Proteobacteria bacterium]|nr:SMP-30/gluconolactonase/LRE family protein [Pseudomonadota bacterium]
MNWQPVFGPPCELGESPFWHPFEQRLYWVDVAARCLLREGQGAAAPERWPMPGEPGCIAPARSGGLVIALRDGIYRAPAWGGSLTLLAPAQHDAATTRFNDGRADPLGRFWAGTLYEPRDRPAAALYALDARAGRPPELRRMAGDATNGNGLAWSPDAQVLYWADTSRHLIRAWDWDANANRLTRERVFHRFEPKPAGWRPGDAGYRGRPDGAAVDVDGNYWCAMYEGGRLAKLSPDGALLAEIELPVPCPTMPCFGGPDLRMLFVTTARHGRSAFEIAAWPLSGHVLALRVDVPGLPVNFFDDGATPGQLSNK